MEPYRFTIRGVDPELVRQTRILAIKLGVPHAAIVNAGLGIVLRAAAAGDLQGEPRVGARSRLVRAINSASA